MKPVEITPSLLRELFLYEPETGKLFWKERGVRFFNEPGAAIIWNADNAGKEVFKRANLNRYRDFQIFGQKFLVHRVVWAIYYGEWPSKSIDHINGQRHDNRLCNLREASPTVNGRNMVLPESNTSGHIGVRKTKSGKWSAHILKDRLGTFDKFEEAVKIREEVQSSTSGFTKRHGNPSIRDLGFAGLKQARKDRRALAKLAKRLNTPIMSHSRTNPIKPRQLPIAATHRSAVESIA